MKALEFPLQEIAAVRPYLLGMEANLIELTLPRLTALPARDEEAQWCRSAIGAHERDGSDGTVALAEYSHTKTRPFDRSTELGVRLDFEAARDQEGELAPTALIELLRCWYPFVQRCPANKY